VSMQINPSVHPPIRSCPGEGRRHLEIHLHSEGEVLDIGLLRDHELVHHRRTPAVHSPCKWEAVGHPEAPQT